MTKALVRCAAVDDIDQLKADVAHTRATVDRLTNLILGLTNLVAAVLQGDNIMALDLSVLTASVERTRTVSASVLVLIKGIPALMNEAIATALAAGASPEELAAIKALSTQLDASSQELVDAVAANTPAAPPPPPPVP